MERKKEHKKQYKVNLRPIISLIIGLTFFSIIIFITMADASKDSKKQGNTNQQDGKPLVNNQTGNETGYLSVVKEINAQAHTITLFHVMSGEELILSYNGGSDITDKYGHLISMSQIPVGAMVEADYHGETGKLAKMSISSSAWEYAGVKNLTIDRDSGIMRIADTKYKFTDSLVVVDGQELISVTDIAEQDELTVRGYEETIWSVTVTRGHGIVTLTDYENLIGASITIGYEAIQQITEDLVITVREGDFNLTVENKDFSATKNVSVFRNQETVVSLRDIGPKAEKKGLLVFEITPFGADMFIDGILTTYANAIEMVYGEYQLEVSLDGYTTFKGILNVDSAGKTMKIDLPKISSGEGAVITVEQGNNNLPPDTGATDPIEDNSSGDNASNDPENGSEEETVDQEHSIIVQQPIGASVYLNGVFKGFAPVTFEKIIGTHVLTFIMEGYETKSYTVEVPDNGLDSYFSFDNLIKSR
ncbi:MAG: hypothetical protein K0S76_1101 [Herbinix sp.]|jgi:hypothetical protein|nr:hypothetical protein [Herbinix sp.]